METNRDLEQQNGSEWKEFNFNNRVLVKLNPTGIKLRKEYYRNLGLDPKNYPLKVDGDGYAEFQLWEIMNLFGREMYNGNKNIPFENMIFKMEVKNPNKTDDSKGKTAEEITDTLKK